MAVLALLGGFITLIIYYGGVIVCSMAASDRSTGMVQEGSRTLSGDDEEKWLFDNDPEFRRDILDRY